MSDYFPNVILVMSDSIFFVREPNFSIQIKLFYSIDQNFATDFLIVFEKGAAFNIDIVNLKK